MNRSIIALALPSIVSNLTTPLLGLMDVAFTGHMGGATYLAAIAVGGTAFNMIYWIFGFLRMGTSGLTAQAFGHASASGGVADTECDATLARASLLALGFGILLLVLQNLVIGLSMRLMDVQPDTAQLAAVYFRILIWSAPAVLMTYVAFGWLLGMQNAKAIMWISIAINVTNFAASSALVIGGGMKIVGVATGTLVAQWTGFIISFAIIFRHYRPKLPPLSRLTDLTRLKRLFRINTDIFLRTLCLVAVTVWFTRTGSRQGTTILAANTLLMQFFMFFSFFMDGFAFAGEALVGRYIGARDMNSLRSAMHHLLGWGAALGVTFSLIYFFCGNVIVTLLTDDASVALTCKDYIGWIALIPLAGFASFTFDGIYIGATLTRRMLVSLIVSMLAYFSVLAIAFRPLGNHGLWLAFIIYILARGLVLLAMRRSVLRCIPA